MYEDYEVTDEPIDLPDYDPDPDPVPEENADGSTPPPLANGTEPEPENRRPAVKRRYFLSEEARSFLSGRLSTVFVPLVYTVVFVVSVPLNAAALVVFARKLRPMKPAVIFMLNLACADLLFALLLPFRAAYHFGGNDWLFGPWMCSLVTSAFYCNMYCSVLLIACISVDRLLAVVYPMQSLSWRRPRNAAVACAAMWVLAAGASLPLLLSQQAFHQPELGITTCHDVLDVTALRRGYAYFFPALSGVLFFLPLLVTAASYARVIRTLSAAPLGAAGRSRRKRRAVVMAATVLVVFVVCFAPTNALLMAHYLQVALGPPSGPVGAEGLYGVYLVALCMGSVSCCLDPLVYYYGSSQCQRQLAAALGCRSGTKGVRSLHSSGSTSSTARTSTCTRTTKQNIFLDSRSSQRKKLLV